MAPVEYTGQEQRITFQLYDYWFGLSDGQTIPPLKSLTPNDIAPYKNNMVLIDLRDPEDEPTLQVIGQLLTADVGQDLTQHGISDIPRRTLLSRITDHYMEVLGNRSPISFDAEFKNKAREKILYRGILLPFSDDGESINFILGAIRWISDDDKKMQMSPPEENAEPPVDQTAEITEQQQLGEDNTPDIIEEAPQKPDAEIEATPTPEPNPATDPASVTKEPEVALKGHLEDCRALIQGQSPAELRSRKSLYDALAAIFDFHHLCRDNPKNYRALLTAEGLKAQKRAPYTPTLKLCFGRDYDKTRLTEYAAALSFAERHHKKGAELPDFLHDFPGGIKGCVRAERDARQGKVSKTNEAQKETRAQQEKLVQEMPALAQFDIGDEADTLGDITLVLTRRNGTQMDVIKILNEEDKVLSSILKRLASDP